MESVKDDENLPERDYQHEINKSQSKIYKTKTKKNKEKHTNNILLKHFS